MSLDGFSMHPLTAELNRQFSGGRIHKISQPNKHTVILSIRQPGKTLSLLISINAQNPVMHSFDKTIENPSIALLFCMVLRKQIEDGRIAEIRQHGLDRIIIIDIDVLGPGGIIITKNLIIELMGKHSNMILLQDNKIIDALKKVGFNTSRVRQVLPGGDYALPPHQDKCNLLTEPVRAMLEKLNEVQSMPLAKAIVHVCLGIGPISAKEFVWNAGLPASIAVGDLAASDLISLTESIEETVSAYKASQIVPTVVMDEHKKILALAAFPLRHLHGKMHTSFDTMSAAVGFAVTLGGKYTIPDQDLLKKFVVSELTKLRNKLEILTKELDDAHHAEEYKTKADILMTYQYQIPPAAKEVLLPNIYADEPEQDIISIALNPRTSVMQNMQDYYRKYNKLKRAQELLVDQMNQCQDEIRYLESVDSSLESSSTLIEVHEIKNELISSGYMKEQKKRKATEKPSVPLKFTAPDDTIVLVGKNNYQNDQLTFKIAQYDDVWLHTKDIPGSHVVIRCDHRPPSEAALAFAASLSAYFSKAKNSSNIPVDYTRRQYVKKPAKAKPGFVIYTNQKTLYVTPNQASIEGLLLKN